jgi:hypothetical protein
MSSPAAEKEPVYPAARRWTRHKLDVPIRVIVHLQHKSRVISGRGKEISEGGMAVFAGVELRVGDKIEIEFTPPYGMPIRVQGIVRNRHGYCYGVEFFAVDDAQIAEKERLRAALHSSNGLGA